MASIDRRKRLCKNTQKVDDTNNQQIFHDKTPLQQKYLPVLQNLGDEIEELNNVDAEKYMTHTLHHDSENVMTYAGRNL